MSEPVPTSITTLVLGLGTSGLAMARWCVRAGMQVTVADTRATPPQLEALRRELPDTRFVCAALDAALLQQSGAQLVLKSPGIPPAELLALYAAARDAAIAVSGELGLFAGALRQLAATQQYQPRILGVTGTNGKTTVTALAGQLVARAGRTVAVAGNIGPTLLDTLATHIAAGTLPAVWVLELSSFQLADAQNDHLAGSELPIAAFEPTASCVLNLTQDHLDWHGTMAAYAHAKAGIFGSHGLMLQNRDDATVMAMRAAPAKGRPKRLRQTFGAGMPTGPGDWGIEQVNGMAWLVRAMDPDPSLKLRRGQPADPLHFQRLMPAEALRIRGRHNAVNALAALALVVAAGCPLAPLLFGLREYRGEPHRVESIGVLDGVEYFDDSKGTNVGATAAALQGLGTERSLVVILGGDGKGQDFTPLAAPVAQYVLAAVLIGRDAPRIRAALQETGVVLLDAPSMQGAVQLARDHARSGDAVLLSPACASLDMFEHYRHRAEVFRASVRGLAHDGGNALETLA